MMHTNTWTFILLFLLSILFVEVSGSPLVPVRTKGEYIDQPIGLDVENPRFGWVLEAKRESVFGQKQTAYRIIVASTVEKIDRKSTRLNSSHVAISYAVFCLKKRTHSKHGLP